MPEEALTSFTVAYVTYIATLWVKQLLTSESRSRTEYLIPTNTN